MEYGRKPEFCQRSSEPNLLSFRIKLKLLNSVSNQTRVHAAKLSLNETFAEQTVRIIHIQRLSKGCIQSLFAFWYIVVFLFCLIAESWTLSKQIWGSIAALRFWTFFMKQRKKIKRARWGLTFHRYVRGDKCSFSYWNTYFSPLKWTFQ